MIYITGDTHSDDCVIICGDFGGIWDMGGESKEEVYWLKWLEEKPFTLLL